MQLSEHTLAVLKNFATINSGVVFKSGKVQKTMNPEQTILAEAHLEDAFPNTFGVYDLNQFLGNVTTLNNPNMDFATESVTMTDDSISLTYYSCSPNLIVAPPEGKELVMKDPDVTFSLSQQSLQKILRIASMNDLPNISIIGGKDGLHLRSHELKNDTSNYAKMRIGDYDGNDFIASFKTENLRLIQDDYTVQIKIGGFSCWTNTKGTMKYFVAMEKK